MASPDGPWLMGFEGLLKCDRGGGLILRFMGFAKVDGTGDWTRLLFELKSYLPIIFILLVNSKIRKTQDEPRS